MNTLFATKKSLKKWNFKAWFYGAEGTYSCISLSQQKSVTQKLPYNEDISYLIAQKSR